MPEPCPSCPFAACDGCAYQPPVEQRVEITAAVIERFWSRVDKTGPCWLWTDVPNSEGYGHLSISNTRVYAHRLSYQLSHGPIPPGLQIDHLCRVRHCVNPDHLEPVTHRVNGLRGAGAFAVNARKTHCVHGHEFTPENTVLNTKGGRRCRECRRIYDASRVPRRRPTKTQWRPA